MASTSTLTVSGLAMAAVVRTAGSGAVERAPLGSTGNAGGMFSAIDRSSSGTR